MAMEYSSSAFARVVHRLLHDKPDDEDYANIVPANIYYVNLVPRNTYTMASSTIEVLVHNLAPILLLYRAYANHYSHQNRVMVFLGNCPLIFVNVIAMWLSHQSMYSLIQHSKLSPPADCPQANIVTLQRAIHMLAVSFHAHAQWSALR